MLSDFTKTKRAACCQEFHRTFPHCFEIEFKGGERFLGRADRVCDCLEEFRIACGLGDEISDANLRLLSNAFCPDRWCYLHYGNAERDILAVFTCDEATAVLLKLSAKV